MGQAAELPELDDELELLEEPDEDDDDDDEDDAVFESDVFDSEVFVPVDEDDVDDGELLDDDEPRLSLR